MAYCHQLLFSFSVKKCLNVFSITEKLDTLRNEKTFHIYHAFPDYNVLLLIVQAARITTAVLLWKEVIVFNNLFCRLLVRCKLNLLVLFHAAAAVETTGPC